ncbi:hypothetical protein C2869_05450 [Saccharobesus litoralis]|uniref:Uncharacterized protein n=1 Tax=Saccharobesus litoralis TaxID=2172099 RepID=A0A2S0VP10_9ALTE|nr:hypothetical protein [Saccharobesus litoralis]AWB65922.1 hypothetical protein C2869_05450 [Saccharobesus litoralis]
MKRAEDELLFYCTDLNLDCSAYKLNGLVKDDGDLRVYEWVANDDPNYILHVRVPYRRIGDATFGLIGADVTVGSIGR